MNGDIQSAECQADLLLLSQRLYSPKIDILALIYDKNIIFDTYKSFCTNSRITMSDLLLNEGMRDGCTIVRKNGDNTLYIVLYNSEIKSRGRINFTLAHELGHIYLNHENDDPCNESAANNFAARLILPPVLVWELYKSSGFTLAAAELANIFLVSKAMAQLQIDKFTKNKLPSFSARELKLLSKFSGLLPQQNGPLVDL